MDEKIRKDETAWKKQLTSNQYYVTRQKGTEPPLYGENMRTLRRLACTSACMLRANRWFQSDTKCTTRAPGGRVSTRRANEAASSRSSETDASHGMARTEVKRMPL